MFLLSPLRYLLDHVGSSGVIAELGAVVFFSLLAFWKLNALLFMVAAGASLMTGFYWYDTYTNYLGLSIGLMLLAYSIVCLILAIGCLFKRRHVGE